MTDMESLELALMGNVNVDAPRPVITLVAQARETANALRRYRLWHYRVHDVVISPTTFFESS